jgi:hypothetical protein
MRWARRAVFGIVVWALVFHIPLYLAYDYTHRYDNATNTSKIHFYRTHIGESQ